MYMVDAKQEMDNISENDKFEVLIWKSFVMIVKSVKWFPEFLQSYHFENVSNPLLLHNILCKVTKEELINLDNHQKVVYYLVNHGVAVNEQDEEGNTVLHLCVLYHQQDIELCEAVLQCGADIYISNKNGQTPSDLVESNKFGHLRHLFQRYKSGLWAAIEGDDLMDVRRLINMWCRVDLQKNRKTLKTLALEKGTENIIRLVIDMEPSLKIAHAVMGNDVETLTEILDSKKNINMQIKNMGDMAATPLYYAIMHNNPSMVKLLCENGATVDVMITMQDEEVPLYYAALHRDTDPEIIKLLTPNREDTNKLLNWHYKGQNVLHYCIEHDITVSAVVYILQHGYPELLARKNIQGLCAREMALALHKPEYVAMIDELVYDWSLSSDEQNRKLLALLGYNYFKEGMRDSVSVKEFLQTMETSSPQATFERQLPLYQQQVSSLMNAVEQCDRDLVKHLMFYESDDIHCFQKCLANALAKDDSQPLIHRAVLMHNFELVDYISSVIQHQLNIQLDTVRDAYFRTALHYAYALPPKYGKQISELLLDKGCSEFSMDVNSQSPQAFKDHRHCTGMAKFLEFHKSRHKSFDGEGIILEPDPFRPNSKMIVKPTNGSKNMTINAGEGISLKHNQQGRGSSFFSCSIL